MDAIISRRKRWWRISWATWTKSLWFSRVSAMMSATQATQMPMKSTLSPN